MHVVRSGHRVVYDASARAVENGVSTAREEFTRRVRIAAGGVQLVRRGVVPRMKQPRLWFQFISHKLLRWISPILFITMFLSAAMLASRNVYGAAFFAAQVCGWSFVLATAIIERLRNTGIGSVFFYFGLSQLAILVGLLKGLLNRQSSHWNKSPRGAHELECSERSAT